MLDKKKSCHRSNSFIWKITEDLTFKSRKKKYDLFMSFFKPKSITTILDIGVSPLMDRWTNFFEIWYPYPENITALTNENLNRFKEFNKNFPKVNLVFGDGKNLPFRNNSFDIGFSNAVIEHVGNRNNQKRFIGEIIRVCKKCFISTPNYWFPIELHTLLPFIHYLPANIRFKLYKKIKKGFWADINHLNLLTPKEFLSLFPNRNINIRLIRQKFMGFTYNLIAIIDKE